MSTQSHEKTNSLGIVLIQVLFTIITSADQTDRFSHFCHISLVNILDHIPEDQVCIPEEQLIDDFRYKGTH